MSQPDQPIAVWDVEHGYLGPANCPHCGTAILVHSIRVSSRIECPGKCGWPGLILARYPSKEKTDG